MKICVIIPCYNHATTLGDVVRAAVVHRPVIVVDDGSTAPLTVPAGIELIRFERNRGKGAALRAAFEWAAAREFTHAITMDADGQHTTEDIPQFLDAATRAPDALLVGVRDFARSGAPPARRRSNQFSNFWVRVETGVRLADTQCGFRCYPLAATLALRTDAERYAYELEALVRASWTGLALVPVPVRCYYQPEQVRRSHYRPLVDTLRIARLNMQLSVQSWLVPAALRRAWSLGERRNFRQVVREFFAEHAHAPGPLALAVGLGLFCGIAPIWGYQMIAAAALAHWWRLNKAIALVASNISIPPIAPFILYAGLALGHWIFTGQRLELNPQTMTMARALEYLWQWFAGSFVLAALVASVGTGCAYAVARLVRRR